MAHWEKFTSRTIQVHEGPSFLPFRSNHNRPCQPTVTDVPVRRA